jgi:hypothetical protein
MADKLGQVVDHVKALEKEVAALKGKLASAQGDELLSQAQDINGVKLLVARLDGADAKTLRDTMDKLKDKLKTAVIVLGVVEGAKVQIAVGVTPDTTGKVKAGELVNFIAGQVGGKGGGKADMAMAGGTEPAWRKPCRAGQRAGLGPQAFRQAVAVGRSRQRLGVRCSATSESFPLQWGLPDQTHPPRRSTGNGCQEIGPGVAQTTADTRGRHHTIRHRGRRRASRDWSGSWQAACANDRR